MSTQSQNPSRFVVCTDLANVGGVWILTLS